MTISVDSQESTVDAEDFVWRFAVPADDPSARFDDDPLAEMVRVFLVDFLNIGFLTAKGERVQCDGFAFLNDPESIHPICRNGVSERCETRR